MSRAFVLADARGRPWLEAVDPRLKLVWLATVSLLGVLLDSTIALASLCVLAAMVATGLKLPARAWLVILGLAAAIVWGTLFSQALFYAYAPRTVLATIIPPGDWAGWDFPGLRVYREGIAHGLAQSLRMLSVMLTGLTACLSTSPERLLAALASLRTPRAISFMAMAGLRFLPVLLNEVSIVRQARRLRGYRPPWSRPIEWLRMELMLLEPVLAVALRRASALAVSVRSRGFDPTARRTYYPPLRLRTWEQAALCTLGMVLLVVATIKLLYSLYVADLYYQPLLRNVYDFARTWL